MSELKQRPNVFQYTDHKIYLRACYEFYRSADKKFSQRFISNQIGASSAGWFSNFVSGRITLTGSYVHRLAKLFKLNDREHDFFELLLNYNQAGSIEEKTLYYDKIVDSKGFLANIVSKERFDFYNKWYIPVIRELLLIYNFQDDYSALAKRLSPPIKPAQAEQAINVLKSLKFITKTPGGYWKPVHTIITKDTEFPTIHWANLMQMKIKFAAEAITRFPRDKRDISDVQIPLSQKGFEEVREDIRALRKKILTLSERDKNRDTVYQCNIQLFPVTSPSPSASLKGDI